MVVVGSRGRPQMRALGGRALARTGWQRRASAVGDGRAAGANSGVAGERGRGAGGEVGPVGGEPGGDGVGALGQPAGQRDDLGGLLAGEGQPAGDLRVDVAFRGGVERHVQQGAGGGDIHPAGEPEQGAEGGEGLLEVVDPYVATVDDAGDQPLAGQPADGREVAEVGGGRAGEVEGQPVDGSLGQHGQCVAEPVEVGGDQQLRAGR